MTTLVTAQRWRGRPRGRGKVLNVSDDAGLAAKAKPVAWPLHTDWQNAASRIGENRDCKSGEYKL
jgi:hypothetical protein